MYLRKKQTWTLALAILFTLNVIVCSALAAVQASNYINTYSASTSAASGGKISVNVQVRTFGNMTKIGATKIVIEQSTNGSTWKAVKTYNSSSVATMLSSGSSYNKTPVTYQGTKGARYRAVVTCYAADGNDSDSRGYTTSPVTAT